MEIPPLEEDRKLLDGFRRGDRDALSAVFTCYAPRVAQVLRHGFTFQSGGRTCRFRGASSTFDLEDRLHDVFARAFSDRARSGYDGLTPYERYIATIAKNLVIDDFRRKERALVDYDLLDDAPHDVDFSQPIAPARPADAEDAAADRELEALVGRFVDGLDAREREVYELRFLAGLQHKEIAERTGLSESKIKTSERRIRTNFFRMLKKNGYLTGYRNTGAGWLRSVGVL
ncbi:MAG: RNA polymerase sigma factor [Deltaproteobacteria bacterium]|jgi:RNA polymerase sigma-70 factor (ECF subfamily)